MTLVREDMEIGYTIKEADKLDTWQGTRSSAVRFDGCHFLPPLGIVNTNKMQNEFCPLLGLLRCLSHMYVSVGLVLEYVAAHMAKWPYVLAPLESMILLICQLFGFIFKRQDYDRFRNSYFQLWVVLVHWGIGFRKIYLCFRNALKIVIPSKVGMAMGWGGGREA